jgi:hypothetical protein
VTQNGLWEKKSTAQHSQDLTQGQSVSRRGEMVGLVNDANQTISNRNQKSKIQGRRTMTPLAVCCTLSSILVTTSKLGTQPGTSSMVQVVQKEIVFETKTYHMSDNLEYYYYLLPSEPYLRLANFVVLL